jgi:hypothetical protein
MPVLVTVCMHLPHYMDLYVSAAHLAWGLDVVTCRTGLILT